MGTVVAFKRPEKPAAKPAASGDRIVGALLAQTFDDITRYLIDPEVSYEYRVVFINYWRKQWKVEPLR